MQKLLSETEERDPSVTEVCEPESEVELLVIGASGSTMAMGSLSGSNP